MDIPKKYCHHCGQQIIFGAKFCSSCGTSQASIDAQPPSSQSKPQVVNRLRPKVETTFTPIGEDDDDDEGIRADRAHSLGELGISMSSLDVDVRNFTFGKETVGSLVAQGQQLPKDYKDPNARIVAPVTDTKAAVAQILAEGNNPAVRLS